MNPSFSLPHYLIGLGLFGAGVFFGILLHP